MQANTPDECTEVNGVWTVGSCSDPSKVTEDECNYASGSGSGPAGGSESGTADVCTRTFDPVLLQYCNVLWHRRQGVTTAACCEDAPLDACH